LTKIETLPAARKKRSRPTSPPNTRNDRPRHGQFRQGHHNLHVPSDVIVDASMPAMIRDSGRMWAPTEAA